MYDRFTEEKDEKALLKEIEIIGTTLELNMTENTFCCPSLSNN